MQERNVLLKDDNWSGPSDKISNTKAQYSDRSLLICTKCREISS